MRLEHKFVVPAPVEQAWAAFNDLERVVPCFPGATLTSYDGDDFAGTCKVKLGPVSLQYAGTGTFVERDPADHHALVEAKGKDRRGNSTASVRVTARLESAGADSTAVSVDTDLTVTGRPATFGRGLIQDVSDQLLAQFITCLTTTLTTPAAAEPSAESTASTAPSAAASGTSGASPTSGSAPSAPSARTQPASGSAPTTPVPDTALTSGSASAAAASGSAPTAGNTPGPPTAATAPTASTTPTASASSTAPTGPTSSATPTAPAASTAPTGQNSSTASDPPVTSSLDLGSALIPALARRARPYLIGAALALVLRRLLRR
ncbi:SRPBCC family protein [Kribbella sp. CA-247076]|uniref:SRPBCC family protein n=1 Tax=Kribbella sp. CA-247076 TaxID=3239941 RepID=UPI003D92AC42